MTHTCHARTGGPHRGIVVAFGAAVGGMFVAALSHLATAPSARADDPVTEIVNAVQNSVGVGDFDWNTGAEYFSGGDVPDGVAYDLAGFDNVLIAPEQDVLVDGLDALTGNSELGSFDLGIVPAPADAEITQSIQALLSDGQSDFTTALTAFSAGDFSEGLTYAVGAVDASLVNAPDLAVLGLTDALLGL